MTQQQMLSAAKRLHQECPGAWVQTDRDLTMIEDVIRDYKRERPSSDRDLRGGKLWWRTHHLIHQLGGEA